MFCEKIECFVCLTSWEQYCSLEWKSFAHLPGFVVTQASRIETSKQYLELKVSAIFAQFCAIFAPILYHFCFIFMAILWFSGHSGKLDRYGKQYLKFR